MIAHVRGVVSALNLDHAVLDVGGVGHLVRCTPNTIPTLRLGIEATVHTSLVVREDSLTLYGFATTDERDMFELVQTASGVGPKVAQAMLAVLSPERLSTAIASADHATLTQVPGIGKKGAERIVLELKDKVSAVPTSATAVGHGEVREALVGLGWSAKDADAAIESVRGDLGSDADVATVLKAALRSMDKRGRT